MNSPFFSVYGMSCFFGSALFVEEVSFELEKGEILALIGPNGSGKSTLLKAAAGILAASGGRATGQVRFKGQDFLKLDPLYRARGVAYVPSELRAEFPLTAYETVQMGRICQGDSGNSQRDDSAVRAAMEKCFCWNLRDQGLHTLSGGERQLVALARAVAQDAKIFLLDEALSKMDYHHQVAIGKVLKQLALDGCALIVVAHDLNLASEWATSALLLKNGKKVATGPLRQTLTAENMATLYPGAGLVVGTSPTSGAPKIFLPGGGGTT